MVRYRLKKKYAILSFLLASFGVVAVVVGSSYAFFTTQVSTKDYIVYTGNLQIDYTKTGNIVNLNNTYPMTNTQGLQTTGYAFNITNSGTVPARYQIRLELSNDNEIPVEYIKLAYIKTQANSQPTDEEITPVLLSDLNSTLTFISNQQIESTKQDSYNLKLWLDINAPNDIQGKTFKAKIVVDAIQDVEDGYVMGSTKPIITLNKFSDGNIDQIIKLNSTFTDPGIESVRDDKDKLTQADVTVTGTVDTTTVGTYTLTYSVTDSDNETAQVERIVAVGDEQSLNIKHSVAQVLTMYTAQQQSSNEAVICSHIYGNTDMYLNCELKDTLDNAIAARNRGSIILTKDLSNQATKTIGANKDFILELNGKKIESTGVNETSTTYNANHRVLVVNGKLAINDNVGTGGIYTGTAGVVIQPLSGSRVVINNGNYNGRWVISFEGFDTQLTINGGTFDTTYLGVIQIFGTSNNSVLTINDGTFNNYIKTGDTNSGIFNINGGTFITPGTTIDNKAGTVNINGGTFTSIGRTIENNGGTITINDGRFESTNAEVITNNSTSNININGGKIKYSKADGTPAILNDSSGIINIKDTSNPVYIGRYDASSGHWTGHGIRNASTGTINIIGNKADVCNSTFASNNRGICIYSDNRAVLSETTSTGTININGATIVSKYKYAVSSFSGGSIDVRNSHLESINSCPISLGANADSINNVANTIISLSGNYIKGNNCDFSKLGSIKGSITYTNNNTFTSGATPIITTDWDF